jgi:hypothetical protein
VRQLIENAEDFMKIVQTKRSGLKKVVVASLAWGLLLTGCSESDKKSSATPSYEVETLTESAWLYGSLPENTIAYARVPNLWSGFSAKDDSFKYALGNEHHVAAMKQIQKGVYENIISQLEQPIKPLAEFYAKHTTGPLEIAFVSQGGQPVVYAGTSLDYEDDTSFSQAIDALVQGLPNANIMSQDDKTKGIVSFGPGAAVYYSYNTDNQRLTIISGMGASVTSLENAAASIKTNDKHEMLKLEADIDASHQGLFVWSSPKNAMPLLQMGMSPKQLRELKEFGIDQARGLALGYGVSDGKTRLKLLLDMPKVGINRFLPEVSNAINVKSVGTPKWAAVMSLPTSEQAERLVSSLQQVGADNIESWETINQQAQKELGVSITTLLDTFGPEVVFFNDQVGTFAAVSYNPNDIKALLTKAQENFDIEHKVYNKNGQEIHHLSVSFVEKSLNASKGAPILGAELAKNYRENYFWTIEGENIVFASVPQLLLERQKRTAEVEVAEWLSSKQGYDANSALLGLTASVDGLSRNSYHYYIEFLMILADITQADIDLMALPTADELGFPEKGAVGLNLRSDKDVLGLEFTFENGGTDLLYGMGSTSSIAVIGILAAVAIPAYQEYALRAEMASGVYAAEGVKLQISQALVNGAKVEDLDNGYDTIQQAHEYENSIIEKIVVNDGVITLFFKNRSLGYGPQTIVYVPMIEGDYISYWDCSGGTVAQKYRPSLCR